ncbi:2-oxoacid:acceptor oxidoreductase family protein [Candidatus Solincola tengchongensis]|uniref:2-oxoacid:acceptor oxidoreductase family protein n=1 Tax=Candidatus Solincola tengchongensis TaxID=2900693 RepID=UPI00257E7805|nr:2-oxoacid:acceptor oxidoreductase family protein [Candidatus Solincola tengchongensis]
MVEIRFHSLGGQGAVTLINLLAQAGDLVGKQVQAFPFFGAERRGAPVKSYVRMDDRPIYLRSQIYRADFLVVMNISLLESALKEGTKESTVVLVNQREEEDAALKGLPFKAYALDATSIALELGMVVEGMPVLNQVFLGAVSYVTEIVPLEAVNEVIRRNVPATRQEASMEAARRGFTSVREVRGTGKRESRERTAAS